MKVLPSFRMTVNAFHPSLTELQQKIKSRTSFSKIFKRANTEIGRDNTLPPPLVPHLNLALLRSHSRSILVYNSILFSTYVQIILFLLESRHTHAELYMNCGNKKNLSDFPSIQAFL